jgi:hypothetical protein
MLLFIINVTRQRGDSDAFRLLFFITLEMKMSIRKEIEYAACMEG